MVENAATKPVILRHWDAQTFGELSEAAMRSMLEGMGYQVSRYVYPPGTCFPAHTHGTDKIDGVLSGHFRMSMGGQSLVLEAGDTLVVPAGAVHSAEVVGDEPVVSLDAVSL